MADGVGNMLAIVTLVFSALVTMTSAQAQYYGYPPYGYRPPPPLLYGFGPPIVEFDYPPPRLYAPRPVQDMSNVCETPRGGCEITLAPRGSSCRCFFKGSGPKAGVVD